MDPQDVKKCQARRLQDLLKNKTKQADFVEKLQVGPVMIGVMAEALGPDQEAELRKDGQTEMEKAQKLVQYMKTMSRDKLGLFFDALYKTSQSGMIELLDDERVL